MPELKQHQYEHQKPHRPSHLARRTKPPPARAEPPDLTLFIYAGLALAVVVMLLAIPYLLQYLATMLTS